MSVSQHEFLLLASLTSTSVFAFFPYRRFGGLFATAAVLTALLAVLDVAIGNLRWQILPAYVLAMIMFAVFLRRRNPSADLTQAGWRSRIATLFKVFAVFVGLTFAVGLPWLFPMFSVPPPTGSFAVGLSDVHLVDETRTEINTEDPDDNRELMIRVWYPAGSVAGIDPEPLVREIEPLHAIFSRGAPTPSFVLSHLQKIPSHSHLDAPPATGRQLFPVLLFSHGNSFYASQNTLLMEHLASHGYIVIAIDHAYHASWVRFPDGRIVNYQELAPGVAEWTPEQIKELQAQGVRLEESFFAEDYDTHFEMMATFLRTQSHGNERAELWFNDTQFVLDQLKQSLTDQTHPLAKFSGAIDLDRVGMFGMSLGGATTGLMTSRDRRIKAGMNMDGGQFGDDASSIQLERPFFWFNADRRKTATDPPVPFELNEFMVRQSKSETYSLTVAGATHASFTDFAIMSRLSKLFLAPIEPWSMKKLMDDYTLAFFNKYLKGTTEPLLDGPPPEHPDILKFERSN